MWKRIINWNLLIWIDFLLAPIFLLNFMLVLLLYFLIKRVMKRHLPILVFKGLRVFLLLNDLGGQLVLGGLLIGVWEHLIAARSIGVEHIARVLTYIPCRTSNPINNHLFTELAIIEELRHIMVLKVLMIRFAIRFGHISTIILTILLFEKDDLLWKIITCVFPILLTGIFWWSATVELITRPHLPELLLRIHRFRHLFVKSGKQNVLLDFILLVFHISRFL